MTIYTPEQAYRHAYRHGLNFNSSMQITENFYWSEAFVRQEKEAVPPICIFFNILKAATEFQKYRTKSGRSFKVTSWYRSPRYNKNLYKGDPVKGALSLHTLGLAIDGNEQGLSAEESRINIQNMIRRDEIMLRMERGVSWLHADTGHPYIPGGMRMGLFNV